MSGVGVVLKLRLVALLAWYQVYRQYRLN